MLIAACNTNLYNWLGNGWSTSNLQRPWVSFYGSSPCSLDTSRLLRATGGLSQDLYREGDAFARVGRTDDVETSFQQANAIQFTVFLAWSYAGGWSVPVPARWCTVHGYLFTSFLCTWLPNHRETRHMCMQWVRGHPSPSPSKARTQGYVTCDFSGALFHFCLHNWHK